MATEVTSKDYAPREDSREVGQEYASGTMDLDANGDGSITVSLTGDLDPVGLGLFGESAAGDGTASLSNITPDSVDVNVSGGTADATDVAWSLVVSEDGSAL